MKFSFSCVLLLLLWGVWAPYLDTRENWVQAVVYLFFALASYNASDDLEKAIAKINVIHRSYFINCEKEVKVSDNNSRPS